MPTRNDVRTVDAKRLDAFVDSAFAFAVTLLVIAGAARRAGEKLRPPQMSAPPRTPVTKVVWPSNGPPRGAVNSIEERLRGLMLGGLAGDARAYRTLLSELSGFLRGYFGKRLASAPADIEDLVQETLLAIHTRRETYDRSQPFTAWAYGVARYKLVDRLRSRSRRETLHDELDDSLFVEPETEAADARRDLMTLLNTLPEGQRAPIILTKLQGLSVEEAAARTGQSISSVKVSVHRGLKKLAASVVTS